MFTREQNSVINCRKLGTKLIRGMENTGKTTASIERAIFLRDSYSLYEEDRILYLSCNNKKEEYVKESINNLDKENEFENISIFSLMNRKIEFYSIDTLIQELYKESVNLNKDIQYNLCSEGIREKIILDIIDDIREEYSKIKFIKLNDIEFIEDEIKLIKNLDLNSYDEYVEAKRPGKPARKYRVNKNSVQRKCLYDIFQEYNTRLKDRCYIDYEDMINYTINNLARKYVHVIVDYCENLTILQLKLIKSLINRKVYSDEIYVMHNSNHSPYAAILNGKRVIVKRLGENVKRFNLKEEVKKISNLSVISEEINKDKNEGIDFMEHFTFVDLKHRRKFNFNRDYNNIDDILVIDQGEEVEYEKDELKEIPVYSNIAAGEPIPISSEQEGRFYLPKYWVKGQDECFILKIKGDSMINAEINHGDYVIIRRQATAENKDIVAVELDGSATLKRLYINKNTIQLLPENEKYSPIDIGEEDNISILGVALGVIGRK